MSVPAGPAVDGAGAGAAGAVTLRPLVDADLDVLAGFERELFGAGAWSRSVLSEELHGPGRAYLGAQQDGALVGYAGLWFDGDDGQVMTIGVTGAGQRQGTGRLLLRALVAAARRQHAARVLLEVRVDNEAAVALYRDEGFVVLGRRRRYYQPEGVDAWTMALDLVASR